MTDSTHRVDRVRLGRGGEFARIRELLDRAAPPGPDILVGPGDDCLIVRGGWAVSTDQCVEGVHFRAEWMQPGEVGYRAAAAAFSDLAAVGARPVGALLSLSVEAGRADAWLGAVVDGARELVEALGASLLGGDLSAAPPGAPVYLDVVSLGRVEHPLLRVGAQPGDELWVTGVLGGAAAAIRAWRSGLAPSVAVRRAFTRPCPRVAEIRWLLERTEVHAGLDISDGLAGDAAHLAAASGVRAVLEPDRLPIHAGVEGDVHTAQELALFGGEDYELLLAAPAGALDAHQSAFTERFGTYLTRVGWLELGEGVAARGPSGDLQELSSERAFDHFADEAE